MHDTAISANLSSETLIPSSSPSVNMDMQSPPKHDTLLGHYGGSPPDQGKRKPDDILTTTPPKRLRKLGPFLDEEDDEHDIYPFADSSVNPICQDKSYNTSASLDAIHISAPSGSNASYGIRNPPKSIFSTQVNDVSKEMVTIRTCFGKVVNLRKRTRTAPVSYEQTIAERSTTVPGRAKRSYYGIDIHKLLDDIAIEDAQGSSRRLQPSPHHLSVEVANDPLKSNGSSLMWTEKYRARKFKDLIGDERTHRSVLRWLKGWDSIVFPGLTKLKSKVSTNDFEERAHRKVLLLTGPPGLGKTTLAHVCAKQAGYEVLEINASDERSRDVVKGRIRDAVGTENVKGVTMDAGGKRIRKPGKPVCIVVDEVDGVVSGSGGGGEGGFMKALIDLVMLDQRNSSNASESISTSNKGSRKGEKFRLLRPLILICNDVYHPSLRPLRASSIAEIIHVRQASLDKVVLRMKTVFEREGIPCDGDGVRRLCEASWGLTSTRERTNSRGIGEGDIRGVLVAGEWIAHTLRAASLTADIRLTRQWVEKHILSGAARDGLSARGLGRGGTKDIVERVFLDGAGFPTAPTSAQTFQDPLLGGDTKPPTGVSDLRKRHAINSLREMVDAAGEYDRCITECFTTYPTKTYQDDTFLSKPNAAYEWLYFHDMVSSKVYTNQDWELNPYLSQSVAAFHHLFSSSNRQTWDNDKAHTNNEDDEDDHPFSGPKADFAAFEAQKQNHAIITEFQSTFSPPLLRTFRSTESIIIDLIPYLTRMLAPEIKPVVVGGSGIQRGVASVRKDTERALVKSAVRVMSGIGVKFENTRVESETGVHNGWVYRMEPPLDTLTMFSKLKGSGSTPVRYAIRQVLQQEYEKEILRQRSQAGQARLNGPQRDNFSRDDNNCKENTNPDGPNPPNFSSRMNGPKRDFFGRVIVNEARPGFCVVSDDAAASPSVKAMNNPVWVGFHEGYSNAVRKRVTLNELLSGL
ncbi:chromosome transmission fidelity protein [Histoplasma capsulatum var. duboisii H88]|uniref:Chromosome transmission fidelity protein n=2 Tax=Ajellomyces capsulatus (strain H88) TaxID=544711 RepID=A0A8A1LSZ9_AJEC8|nr:chromosome transmission fidelity protein [Histoplasma capsulatum var. duboisii H88]